jgi:hypothetical protein
VLNRWLHRDNHGRFNGILNHRLDDRWTPRCKSLVALEQRLRIHGPERRKARRVTCEGCEVLRIEPRAKALEAKALLFAVQALIVGNEQHATDVSNVVGKVRHLLKGPVRPKQHRKQVNVVKDDEERNSRVKVGRKHQHVLRQPHAFEVLLDVPSAPGDDGTPPCPAPRSGEGLDGVEVAARYDTNGARRHVDVLRPDARPRQVHLRRHGVGGTDAGRHAWEPRPASTSGPCQPATPPRRIGGLGRIESAACVNGQDLLDERRRQAMDFDHGSAVACEIAHGRQGLGPVHLDVLRCSVRPNHET